MKTQIKPLLVGLGFVLIGAGCFGGNQTPEPTQEEGTAQETNQEGGEPLATIALENGSYTLNADASNLRWTAYGVGKAHTGTADITEGTLTLESGVISAGSFTVDMTTFGSDDLQGALKEGFDAHMHSAEFLDIETYPTAVFTVDFSKQLTDTSFELYGSLNMKGVEKDISFDVELSQTDPEALQADGTFTIDRTEWGIEAQSGNFFQNLGDSLVEDNVDFAISLQLLNLE